MTSARPVPARLALFVTTLAVAVLAGLVPADSAEAADRRKHYDIRDRIEYMINRERTRNGLPRLRVHKGVQRLARDHSLDMARYRDIWHDPYLRHEVPRRAMAWGENVARTTARDAAGRSHYLFMSSSGHRANVLRGRWTHMGIGVAKRGRYTYITQRFFDR